MNLVEPPELLAMLKSLEEKDLRTFSDKIVVARKETCNVIIENCNLNQSIMMIGMSNAQVNELAMHLMVRGSQAYQSIPVETFLEFKKIGNIPYSTLEEIQEKLEPKINKLKSVKTLLKEQKQSLQKLKKAELMLKKKLGKKI